MQIGVVLSIEGNEQAGIPYRTVRDLALQAEQAGFDSLWLYDHFLFRSDESTAGQWECFTFLAALAEATECITLGTLVACTAFRNPALTAKIATALDEVSNGRFVLGLGAGWNETELKISTPMWVAFDDLGTIPPHMAESRYQSAEAVAARLRQLDALGTDHVMIDFRPNHEASLTRISEALKLYRES